VRAGRLRSINVSSGGVPKRPVPEAEIGPAGLLGDRHDSPRHGGPDAAVCLYAAEAIARVAADGHPIAPGTTGENLTVEGLDWSQIVPGVCLRIGRVLLQVTRYTTPCATIRASFRNGHVERIDQERHAGDSRVYARVLSAGTVRVGQTIEVVSDGDA
jgi:MOSC domain-containing protein YiiM